MPYIGQSPATGEANSFKTLDDITSYTLTFDGSSASTVSVANDTITERNHRFVTGQRVTYNDGGGTSITGLSDGVYYIIVEDKHTIKLATNANNAAAGTAINLTGLGVGSSHTLNVAFDGVNTKFKATVNNGTRADITSAPQVMLSINGVLQQPHNNTTSPTTGYAVDHTSTIIFSAAPATSDQFFASLVASSAPTFDISDNVVDNFTGDGSATDFTLSKAPPNNESVLVTIDGVVQYPDDTGAVRAYTVSENILTFASAPGNGVEIQVRHIGFAGASTGGISGFYGRTGNAVLKSTDNIVFNNATASGTVQAANVTVTGDLTVEGTTTTLDTDLIGVDKLEVAANNTTVGAAITQSGTGDILNLYDGGTEVFSVLDGGAVRIGGNAVSGAAAGVVLQDGTGVIATRSSGSSPVFRGYTQGDSSANFTVKADGKLLLGTETEGAANADNFTVADSGNCGITIRSGTSSNSNIYFSDATSGSGEYAGYIQYRHGDNALAFGDSSAERLRITSGGFIGAGTANPRRHFHLHNSASATVGFQMTNGNTGESNDSQGFQLKVASDSHAEIAQMENSDIRIFTNASERLRITSTGTLDFKTADGTGINFRESGYINIDSDNNDSNRNFSFYDAKGTGSEKRLMILTDTGLVGINTSAPNTKLQIVTTSGARALTLTAPTLGPYMVFETNSTPFADIGSEAGLTGSGSNVDMLTLNARGSRSLSFRTNSTERLRISSSGNVTANSENSVMGVDDSNTIRVGFFKKSGLYPGIAAANNAPIAFYHSDAANIASPASQTYTERLRIDSDGRLIAGGATASNAWTGGDDLILGNTNSGTRTGITLVSHSGSDGGIYWSDGTAASAYRGQLAYNHANDTMSFYTAAAAHLRITSGGIVLINDATVSSNRGDAPLQIETGANGNALNLRARSGDNIYSYLNFQNNAGSQTAAHIYLQRDASNNAGTLVFGTAAASANTPTERLRITSDGKVSLGGDFTPGATLHIRDSNNTTKGAAQLKISKGVGSNAAPTSISRTDCYIHLGGSEWGAGGTGIYLMGLGYTNGETGTGIPAYIGYRETTSSGYTYGDLIFGTRGNTTGTSNPTERLRIDSQGRLGVGVTPKGFHANNKDVIQGSSGYVILGRGTSSLNICQNFYYDSSDAGKYIATGAATVYNQSNGSHTFYNASSGSADAGASLVERFQIQSDGRVSIGAPAANALGALHIHANQGTDTALWIGDNSQNRYLSINEQGSTSNFNHIHTRFNDNAIHAHYILDNPYASGTGYGSQILFRGNNQGTTAYIETSNEASGSARGTLRLRGADNHGLDVRSTGEVNTTHASNIGYNTNAATNTRSLVHQSRDPQRQEPAASDWYILKTFHPNKSGTVNMHAEMYIASGTYYFSFRVREEGTDTIVFNAGDNGGYTAYATNGNAVHSYKIYKWICPLIKAHKRYYIEMAATNAAGTAGPYTSAGQWLYLKNFSVYSMSGGHSEGTEAIQIGQSQDVSSATANSGTTHFYMSPGVNRASINVTQYFAGTESTFLGWFTSRAYNRYIDFELNLSGSYMWFAQAYGYLYSRGQVAGSMISGYTYSGNQILNKYSHTFGNRGWYGSYRTSGGNLCLKFDSGNNGYTEGRIALFLGTHGPTNPEWRVLQYRQNDTTNNIF